MEAVSRHVCVCVCVFGTISSILTPHTSNLQNDKNFSCTDNRHTVCVSPITFYKWLPPQAMWNALGTVLARKQCLRVCCLCWDELHMDLLCRSLLHERVSFFFFSDFTFFFLSWKMTGVKCFVRVFIAHGCMFLLCTDESDICFFFSLFLVFVHRICFVFTYLNKVLQSYALWLISLYCQSALCDHSEAMLVEWSSRAGLHRSTNGFLVTCGLDSCCAACCS